MDENIVEKGLVIGTNIVETNAKKYLKKRYLYPDFEDSVKNPHSINLLIGLRGTGKTVMISQYLSGKRYAYLQMDYSPIKSQNLYDILQYLYKVKGIQSIVLDEFQDCMDFSSLKMFFEETKGQVELLISGSSAVAFYPAELTRRISKLTLQPLSFREYLYFKKDTLLPTLSLEEILEGGGKELLVQAPLIKRYMSESLPYMLEKQANMMELLDKIIRHDLVVFRKINSDNVKELENIVLSVALTKGETSYTSLSNKTGVEKTQLMRYFSLLGEALLIKELMPFGRSAGTVHKERKFYLTPPFRNGICKELGVEADVGMLREEFFVQHTYKYPLNYMYGKGMPDFVLNEKKFEIGGPSKNWKQVPDYLVVDEKVPSKGELPLVAFGFLY